MNNWFPFTDYDFYAYLTAGMIVLASLDYGVTGGEIAFKDSWPFVHIVFAVALAYLTGQIVASVASVTLEHGVARRVLRPPVAIMLELGRPRFGENFVGRWIVGRYYTPFPDSLRNLILRKAGQKLEKAPGGIRDPEEIFQVAFPEVTRVESARKRMEDFRRLYGFSRNITLAGFVGAVAICYRAQAVDSAELWWLALLVLVVSTMMFGRFLKFYAAYGAEVLRTYASLSQEDKQ